MNETLQVNEAITITNQLLDLVQDAEKSLTSARNWGFIDLLGGGFITDLIKHSKISKASNSMDQVNYLMQRLQSVLGSIQIPQNYNMNLGGFSTFADFFFDGTLADGYMTYKIMSSIEEVRSLKNKLYTLKSRLESL